MNPRAVAALVLQQVITEGHSLTFSLSNLLNKTPEPRDQALVQAICYGVCRWHERLAALAAKLLERPLKNKDQDIYALLLVGIYQLLEMRIPDYAAVADTVNATNDLKKPWAKGLLNAVLRNYLRQSNALLSAVDKDINVQLSFPVWLLQHLQQAWPQDWEKIVAASNQNPPLALRVNSQRITREMYLEKLNSNNMPAVIIPETVAGMVLEEPVAVTQLPGFLAGEVSVQDGAAQLVVELLNLTPELRVLDACAAPGGKTAHILELQADAQLTAIDVDADRVELVRENLKRLGLQATCVAEDANDVKKWWDGNPFDRILLDAPCSATGVIRRHPDIKLLRRASDIKLLAQQQLQLLNSLWRLLKPGGILLYTTCSIFPEENELVVQQFLAQCQNCQELPIETSWGHARAVGKQILPGEYGMDGFYYARLVQI